MKKDNNKWEQEKEANSNSRRNFLRTSTLAGAAMFAAPAFAGSLQTKRYDSPSAENMPVINKRRTLGSGKNALEVSALGFGCMGMSYERSQHPNKEKNIALIRQAYEHGVTYFDTAEIYGPYVNEELVGEAVAPFRDKVVVSSKFGIIFDPKGKIQGTNSRPEHIKQTAEASLKRLKTDRLDIFYQHFYDPNVPLEDVAGTVKELIQQGKVKHFGLCGVNGDQIRKAHAVQPVTVIQSEFSMMYKKQQAVLPVCEELGIGFVPYSPLNRGYLGGNLYEYTRFDPNNDNRATFEQYKAENIRQNLELIARLCELGRVMGMTSAQLALAWLMHQKQFIVPIPGTTKISHLEENLRTAEMALSESDYQELNKIIDSVKLAAVPTW
jgi:aryl-alcohol dehydrogenase-like predicted oxidoreductase